MTDGAQPDRSVEIARHALTRMDELDIVPSPENYLVWYMHASGDNPDISHRIDRRITAGDPFTPDVLKALYALCMSTRTPPTDDERDAELLNASTEIENSVAKVMELLGDAGADAARYGATLATADGALASNGSAAEMHRIFSDIAEETRRMVVKNREVNERLEESNRQIADLNAKIADIRQEAMCDSLTGLQNRRAFDLNLNTEVELAQQKHTALSLLILDIDHFKSFNDNYGHQLGDQVIKLVARCLEDCTKGLDTPARYGGEEFAIILPKTRLDGATAVAELIRETVASKQIRRKSTGETLANVTISIGAAAYDGLESAEALIERADSALYDAKRSGRNRVVSAPEPESLCVVGGNDAA